MIVAGLSLASCNIPRPTDANFNDTVATEVAAARTLTVMQTFSTAVTTTQGATTSQPSQTIPTVNSTPSPSPTPIDFETKLGMPTWKDELNSGAQWSLSKPNTDTPNVTVGVENGVLYMTRSVAYGGKNWWLNFQMIKDFYLEAKINTQECKNDDQYGLIFRAPNYSSGFGYYFTITCDGIFNLMRWDQNGSVYLFKWEKSAAIQSGANKTNTFGVLARSNSIKLFANGFQIKEVTETAINVKGHFGLFIDPQQTPGFRIEMDEIEFWVSPQGF